MYVVSFKDYRPSPRYDDIPWLTAKIQESASEAGPWIDLEIVPLNPVDPDPSKPISRNFTTQLATLEEGWYRIVFADSDGDVVQPTLPIHNKYLPDEVWAPTVSAVGALLRARTKDTYGNELGTFTQDTRPTDDQVRELIPMAIADITAVLGDDIAAVFYEEAEALAALKTAMLVELSFFPEQVRTGRSPFAEYERMYDTRLAALIEAAEVEEVETSAEQKGFFTFPTYHPIGGVRW